MPEISGTQQLSPLELTVVATREVSKDLVGGIARAARYTVAHPEQLPKAAFQFVYKLGLVNFFPYAPKLVVDKTDEFDKYLEKNLPSCSYPDDKEHVAGWGMILGGAAGLGGIVAQGKFYWDNPKFLVIPLITNIVAAIHQKTKTLRAKNSQSK